MKHGKTLVELAMELQRQNDAKRDFVADTRTMTMTDDGTLTIGDTITLDVGETAHDQLATRLGIPQKYYDRMREKQPDLLATNVNRWLTEEPETRLVRTLDGTARAFLSNKYRILVNMQIAEAVLPTLSTLPGARVESCEITDRRMYLKVVNPKLEAEIRKGDVVQSGLIITNSEIGLGSVKIQPMILRLVCLNGMTVNEAGINKKHVGRTLGTGDEDFSIYSDETLRADDRAFVLKVQDTIRSIAEQVHFDRVVNLMRDAAQQPIKTTAIPRFVELAASEYTITKSESAGVLDYLIRGGDLTQYGLSNAVTRYAQDVESYDRSSELEAIGYDVLTTTPKLWKNLHDAVA